MNSIKFKIILFISLILLLSIGTISTISYYRSQINLTLQMQENLLELTKASSRGITSMVKNNIAEVESLANDRTIISLDKDNALNRIERDLQRLPHYEMFLVVDLKGNVLFGNNNPTGNRSDRDYFKQVIASGKTVVSDPLFSRTTNNLIHVIASPVKNGPTPVGILIATVKIETINQFISTIKTGKTGYAFALSSDATIFAHPNKDNIMKLNLLKDSDLAPSLRDIGSRMAKKESGVLNYQFQGQDKYMGFMPIADTPWSIGIGLTTIEFMDDITATRNFTLGLALLVTSFSIILVYFFIIRMIKPIQLMTKLAESIASGDYTQETLSSMDDFNRPSDVSKQDEIDRLFYAFRDMVKNTRELLFTVQQNAYRLAASSLQLTISTENSASSSTLIASSITQVATSAAKQTENVSDVTNAATQAAKTSEAVATTAADVSVMADKMLGTSQQGQEAIENVIRTMHLIKSESAQSAEQALLLAGSADQIKEIVNVIQAIAAQTNLLALNAAIEAARAGENGRGFAVVADEVRKLAEQSASSSEQIKALIDEIYAKISAVKKEIEQEGVVVSEGIAVAGHAGESFKNLSDLLNLTVARIKEVGDAIRLVTHDNQNIVASISSIDESSHTAALESQRVSSATDEQVASMQQISASIRLLANMAEDLNEAVIKFRL